MKSTPKKQILPSPQRIFGERNGTILLLGWFYSGSTPGARETIVAYRELF